MSCVLCRPVRFHITFVITLVSNFMLGSAQLYNTKITMSIVATADNTVKQLHSKKDER